MRELLKEFAVKYNISELDLYKLNQELDKWETGLNTAADVLLEKYPSLSNKGYDPLMIIEKSYGKIRRQR